MAGSTPELALKTAVDADDTADYLTLSLADSLRTVDALYNNVTGHTHNGAHQGGPIGTIPLSAIPDGSITSAKIADATIATADLADRSVTSAKIAVGTIVGGGGGNISGLTITGGGSGNIAIGTITGGGGGNIAANTIVGGVSGNIAPGGITTVDIQGNSVQAILGSFSGNVTFSTTALAAVATPITVSITTTGNPLRCEAVLTTYHSVAGGGYFMGIAVDGGISYQAFMNTPVSNYAMTTAMILYTSPAAGTHTITVYITNQITGTVSIHNALPSYLYVTEQKR